MKQPQFTEIKLERVDEDRFVLRLQHDDITMRVLKETVSLCHAEPDFAGVDRAQDVLSAHWAESLLFLRSYSELLHSQLRRGLILDVPQKDATSVE